MLGFFYFSPRKAAVNRILHSAELCEKVFCFFWQKTEKKKQECRIKLSKRTVRNLKNSPYTDLLVFCSKCVCERDTAHDSLVFISSEAATANHAAVSSSANPENMQCLTVSADILLLLCVTYGLRIT